jgi:hypothetical protein
MEQFVFFVLLYSVGLMFGLQFYRKLPLMFVALSAFFWGALGWVILTLFLCSLALPFTFRLMATIETLTVIGLMIIFLHKNKGNIQHADILILLAISFLFLLITALAIHYNAANLTNDSYNIILYGESIAYTGFSNPDTMTPFAFGIFMPVIQSAAPFLKLDYLYAFQPLFSTLFLGIMFQLINYTVRKTVRSVIYSFLLSILGVFVFVTTPGVMYHFFYIHTNFTAASYLFLSIVTFWLGRRESNSTWFIFSALGLLAFTLVRTETPIFALMVLAFMARYLHYRNRLAILLPLVLVIILWQCVGLFLFPENEDAIVSGLQTILVISFYTIFALFLLLSKFKIVERFITPYIPHYLFIGSVLGAIALFVAKPEHMFVSLSNVLQNLFQTGGWGVTWVIVFFLMVFSYSLPRIKNEELFLLNIIVFFVFILALGFFRGDTFGPYRARWTDSANRMSLHILPLSIYYLTVKYSYAVEKGDKASSNISIV